MSPSTPDDATKHLVQADARLKAVTKRFGPPPARTVLAPKLRYDRLATSILHQQLAGAAAQAICRRVGELAGGPLTAEFVLDCDPEAIRSCGVSASKLVALTDLAAHVADGRLQLAKLARLDDEVVIGQLVAVRGIGRWTAQMFLMSALARPDVWPVDDFGVRAGWTVLTGTPEHPKPKALDALAEPYRPHRSALAWYCWQLADEAKEQRR